MFGSWTVTTYFNVGIRTSTSRILGKPEAIEPTRVLFYVDNTYKTCRSENLPGTFVQKQYLIYNKYRDFAHYVELIKR